MGPEPATSKSRGSRYRSNEAQPNNHKAGDSMERGSQRSESGKGKSDKDGGGTESGRGVKRRSHGGGGGGGDGGGQGGGGTLGAMSSSTHRSSKRYRGDALETLDIPIPTADRWDGGGTADTPKENAVSSSGKSNKHESFEGRSGEGISAKGANAQLSKDGLDREVDKVPRKHKVSKASLVASDSRAITVMDLQEADVSIIDSNIRIKNKVSYRRETTIDYGEPEYEKSVEENTKNVVESSRSRRRWDRDGHRGGAEDPDEERARGNVVREGSSERDRKKERPTGRDRGRDREKDRQRDRDKDRDTEARVQNGRRSADGSREFAEEVDGKLEMSDDADISNDFKIQEELRNIELEKELENRIRRRREESGDRDRWRDDDREREGKRHSNSRERDERAREERHRSRRDRERHSDRHESRQHREGSKLSEGRQREDRYYESDREYRSHREDRYHGSRSKDLEDHDRSDRNRDQDRKDRKGRETSITTVYEAERRGREKGSKDDHSDRERSHPTTVNVESSDGARNEHKHKRVRESDGEGYGAERDHSRQRSRPGESDSLTGNEVVHDDRPRRKREDRDADGRRDGSRGSPKDSDGTRGKGYKTYRNDRSTPSEMGGEGVSPRHEVRSPSSNRVDYMSSPHLDSQRSPRYRSQRSPSHMDRSTSRGKTGHGEWFEASTSASNSSGPQRRSQGPGLHVTDRRDRAKWNSFPEEEAKGGMLRASRGIDDDREGSLSPHRLTEQHLPASQSKPPLHGQDSFPRSMGSRGMSEGRSDRGGWRAPGAFDGGALEHHGPDDLSPRDRSDRGRRMPMNRPPGGSMIRSQGSQMSSLPAPPLAPLPPPPPFRPGIDNPSVLGPLNGGGFDDAGGSREQGRGERKSGPHRRGDPGGIGPGDGWRGVNMGNWNSRNQGPLPGNGFAPFPPQFGHPPAGGGGFPGMGQQFPGPPIFPGGGRPPMDMGFGGGRFLGPGGHMGEGVDGYLGPNRGAGWHGPGDVDDGRGPPLLGPGDGWEGPGPHGDDRLRHGRMEWERGGPMGVRHWERDREREIWEARRDGAPDFMPHRPPMDAPPQNQAFPQPASGWVIPRDNNQMPNDLKPRQDRQPFDVLEVKRKPDGPSKPKISKSNSRSVPTSEGKLSKYATATMQSVLSQLDISPELAGPELYAQYQALLPASASGKQNVAEQQEATISDPIDEDLSLEADPEAEALIASPNLLQKILPPLPDGVFEEALRLYRKPETENRVQKSSRGCFVLPFDPSTIKVPSISLMLAGYDPRKAKDERHDGVGTLLDHPGVNVLGTEFAEEFVKPEDETLNTVEPGQDGVELEGAETEDMEGEAMQGEFISSHVEVAEYSDREFEAEIEEPLEYDSSKEMPVGGALSETLDPVDDDKDSVDHVPVNKESIVPVHILDHAKASLTEVDNYCQLIDAAKSESVVVEMGHQEDNMTVEVDTLDNIVVKCDQIDTTVVVEANQADNVIVEAYQLDNAVVEGDPVDNAMHGADQLGNVVDGADQVDNVIAEAYLVDSTIDEADQVVNAVDEAELQDNLVIEAYQLDNIVDEAERANIVVIGADQVDNVVVEVNHEANIFVEAVQVDNVGEDADQEGSMVNEAEQVDNTVDEANVGENVNSFDVSTGVVNYDNTDEPEKSDVVEEKAAELEVVASSENVTEELMKPLNVQSAAGIQEERPLEVLVSQKVEQSEDIDQEILERKRCTGVEDEIEQPLTSVEGRDDLKDVETVRVPDPMSGEANGVDIKQGSPESPAVGNTENHQFEVVSTVTQDDIRKESNGKLKEIVEISPAREKPLIEELQEKPLTRLRKQRVSSRLRAQQAVEAQAVVQQEPSDDVVGQGSVSKKSGSKGATRTSQRRSKRRGSTH